MGFGIGFGAGLSNGSHREWVTAITVSPALSDTVDLARKGVAIVALTAGTIKILDEEGNTSTIPTGIAVGVPHPVRVRRIFATGTTVLAANLVLLHSRI